MITDKDTNDLMPAVTGEGLGHFPETGELPVLAYIVTSSRFTSEGWDDWPPQLIFEEELKGYEPQRGSVELTNRALANKAIAALRAENERLRSDRDCEKRLRKDSDDQATDLRVELEQARADAERWRFLEREAYQCVVPHGVTVNGSRIGWITRIHPGQTFASAIDAARQPEQEGGAA